MKSLLRLALVLSTRLAAGAALIACGSDSEPEPAPGGGDDAGTEQPSDTGDETGQTGTLQLTYSPMYSAYVEGDMHEAQVPVMLKDPSLRGKGAKFTSSDESIAVVTDTEEGGMVTVKKDGMVTINAELDGETGQAKLIIKKYTEAQWMAGQARFSRSDLAIVPAMPGGKIHLLALASGGSINKEGACNTCHTEQAKTLKIQNTPQQIAGYSDEDLITIFTMGMKPADAAQKSMIPPLAWGRFHSWTVAEEDRDGLIAFLRTQSPKPNPAEIDYGVGPCPGAPAPMQGMIPMLCDSMTGEPVSIPGLPGQGSGTDAGTTTDSDAGTTSDSDAGTTMDEADAGAEAADAG